MVQLRVGVGGVSFQRVLEAAGINSALKAAGIQMCCGVGWGWGGGGRNSPALHIYNSTHMRKPSRAH